MFPAARDAQRLRFYRALYRIVVTRDGRLDEYLAELGRAHRKFGVRKEHYAAFRTALLAAANRFTPPGPANRSPTCQVSTCPCRPRGGRGHRIQPARALPGGRHRPGPGQGDHRGGRRRHRARRGTYISGPDAMIVTTASALRTLGADPARLHYDLPDGN